MAACDQVAVPPEHPLRAHQQPEPMKHLQRALVQQGGEERPAAGRTASSLAQLLLQEPNLVPQRQDLHGLVRSLIGNRYSNAQAWGHAQTGQS
jgi:hypothetical protein